MLKKINPANNPDTRPLLDHVEADDAPIWGPHLNFGGRSLGFKDPVMVFRPALKGKPRALHLDVPPPLDIHLVASNRQELLDDLAALIVFLWDDYVGATDESLTRRARALKRFLLDHIEERDA